MSIIATREYVDSQIKRIKDALDIELPPVLESDIPNEEDILLDPKEIRAADLEQDPEHRMVTDAQIELFRRKPNLFEIKEEIAAMRKSIEAKLDMAYLKLLNTPEAVNRLRRLSMILQNDDVLAGLFKTLDDTVTVSELKEHTADNHHLTNVDRKSLILLQMVIDSGVIDKLNKLSEKGFSASYTDLAKDATTISGKTVKDLGRIGKHSLFIGHSDYCLEDECDIFVKASTEQNDALIPKFIHSIGITQFSLGRFPFIALPMEFNGNNHTIIAGCGNNTVLEVGTILSKQHIFRDLKIIPHNASDTATIKASRTKFEDVIFVDCKIDLGEELIFRNCEFNNCTFKFSIGTSKIIMSSCFFKNCVAPKNNSANNVIISDNIQF